MNYILNLIGREKELFLEDLKQNEEKLKKIISNSTFLVIGGAGLLGKEFIKAISYNKGMLDKTDICGALIYLLSDMSEYLNGQNIIIDDGFSL